MEGVLTSLVHGARNKEGGYSFEEEGVEERAGGGVKGVGTTDEFVPRGLVGVVVVDVRPFFTLRVRKRLDGIVSVSKLSSGHQTRVPSQVLRDETPRPRPVTRREVFRKNPLSLPLSDTFLFLPSHRGGPTLNNSSSCVPHPSIGSVLRPPRPCRPPRHYSLLRWVREGSPPNFSETTGL